MARAAKTAAHEHGVTLDEFMVVLPFNHSYRCLLLAKPPNTTTLVRQYRLALCFQRAGGTGSCTGGFFHTNCSPRRSAVHNKPHCSQVNVAPWQAWPHLCCFQLLTGIHCEDIHVIIWPSRHTMVASCEYCEIKVCSAVTKLRRYPYLRTAQRWRQPPSKYGRSDVLEGLQCNHVSSSAIRASYLAAR